MLEELEFAGGVLVPKKWETKHPLQEFVCHLVGVLAFPEEQADAQLPSVELALLLAKLGNFVDLEVTESDRLEFRLAFGG